MSQLAVLPRQLRAGRVGAYLLAAAGVALSSFLLIWSGALCAPAAAASLIAAALAAPLRGEGLASWAWRRWLARRLREAALAAGYRLTRLESAHRVSLAASLGAAAGAVAAPLAGLVACPLGVAAAVLGVAAPLLLLLHYRATAFDVARAAEEELPFVALWAWMLERAGAGAEEALRLAASSGLMRGWRGASSMGLDGLARVHPSQEARRLLRHYLAVREMGGDTVKLLEDWLRDSLAALRARIAGYGETALGIGSMAAGAAAIGLMVSLLGPSAGVNPAAVAAASLLAAAASIAAIHAAQPRLHDDWGARGYPVSLALGVLAAAAVVAATGCIAAGLAAGLAAPSIYYIAAARRIAREHAQLTALVRLVLETARSRGAGITAALESAAGELEEPLRSAARRAARLGEAAGASWITRYTLYTLTRIAASRGVADSVALENLVDIIHAYREARREAATRLKLLAGLAMLIPAVMVAAAALIERLASSLPGQGVFAFSPTPLKLYCPLTAATASMVGLVAGKAVSLTIRNTLPAAAAAAATAASCIIAKSLLAP